MRRLFVPADLLRDGELTLDTEERRYVARVLRLKPGTQVELFDGEGRRAEATLTRVSGREVRCRAEPPRPDPPSSQPALEIGLPPIKGARLDLAVRMLTELGATAITLLSCARSVPREDDGGVTRSERLHRVTRAAARQCGRARLPELRGPLTLEQFAAQALAHRLFGALDPTPSDAAARLSGPPTEGGLTLCTGPEGGFTEAERALLVAQGFEPIALGPHVLRAETAAVVAAAVAQSWLRRPR